MPTRFRHPEHREGSAFTRMRRIYSLTQAENREAPTFRCRPTSNFMKHKE